MPVVYGILLILSNTTFQIVITGMKPQSKLWKQISQQAAGYYTLRFAGLFDLKISIYFVFEI